MSTLQERIREILTEMPGPERGKQVRLAAIAGCTRGLVNQWLKGSTPTMGYEYAKNIEEQMGYAIPWLMDGVLPKKPRNAQRALTLPAVSADAGAERRLTLSGRRSDDANSLREGEIDIPQYNGIGGAMGHGVLLRDQPGEIHGWRVTLEWVNKNVKNHTGAANLRIVTGFGDSMRPLFNPGDPLLVDAGVRSVDFDSIYFFRIGDEGFIKRLQRVPGQGLLAISENKSYRDWVITPDMDFEVFARVIKVWCGSDF
jgi:phage repressor protein C with HTH and peptisase S24 domain